MRKIKFSFIILLMALFNIAIAAQSIDKITTRCPAPNNSFFASILATNTGDITYRPCPTRTNFFFGSVDFTNATILNLDLGLTNGTFPIGNATGGVSDSFYTFDGTIYRWNNTLNNATFLFEFTPSNINNGTARIGSLFSTGIEVTESAELIQLTTNQSNLVEINLVGGVGFLDLTAPVYRYFRTVTTAGTTGNQTINRSVGSVNFAAGANTLTVNNTGVNTNSLIFITPQRVDTTCTNFTVTPAGGGFIITSNATCTAETRVAFFVTN